MKRYVRNYINSCLCCLCNKQPSGKTSGSLFHIEKQPYPMDTLHLNHLGPFVKSAKNNAYLLVVVDAFIKFVFFKVVTSTKTVIRFLDHIFEDYM